MYKISKLTKILIIIMQIFNIVISIVTLIEIYKELQNYNYIACHNDITHLWLFLILSFVSYISVKSIIVGIFLSHFIFKKTDMEILENRHILLSFSITLGGIFTPFVLTMLPNITTNKLNNTKKLLSRIYAFIYIFGGASVFIISYLSFLPQFKTHIEDSIYSYEILTGVMIFSLILFFLGILNLCRFYNKKNEISKLDWVLIYINQFFITLNLIFLMLISITRIVYWLLDNLCFSTSNEILKFSLFAFITFNIWNILLMHYYIWWVIKMAINCIKIIWSKEEKIYIYAYEKVNNLKNQMSTSY